MLRPHILCRHTAYIGTHRRPQCAPACSPSSLPSAPPVPAANRPNPRPTSTRSPSASGIRSSRNRGSPAREPSGARCGRRILRAPAFGPRTASPREASPPDPLSTRHGPGLLVSPHPLTPSPQSGEGEPCIRPPSPLSAMRRGGQGVRLRSILLVALAACGPTNPCTSSEMHLRARFSEAYVGHWVVARGDTVTLPEMGDRFKLTDLILDTARVAVGRTCHYKGALVFAVPRAETLAVTWYGSPEQALIYGWPASARREWATHWSARSCSTRGSACKCTPG